MRFTTASLRNFWHRLGPGLITGASDDDPSGITAYSIAGARAGYRALWTPLWTLPLMAAVQEMCARIGIVTGKGLAGVIRSHYGRPLLAAVVTLLVGANTLNIAADLQGMAEAAHLVIPAAPSRLLALLFAAAITAGIIRFPYAKLASALKWLTFFLFSYVIAAFFAGQDWPRAIAAAFVPRIEFSREFVAVLVAVLGTTISPYLFFWMASEEVEERREAEARRHRPFVVTRHELKGMKTDVVLGMVFSNLIMYFIIATAASVFAGNGLDEFSGVAEVASALRPLAGDAAFLLFAVGAVGTGLLAIPVLAGSSAYALSEMFGWREGLSKKFREARAFYGVIIASAAIGFLLTFSGRGAVYMLFMTAVLYGLISPLLIAVVMHVANNRRVMGDHANGAVSNILGGAAFLAMSAAAIAWIMFSLI